MGEWTLGIQVNNLEQNEGLSANQYHISTKNDFKIMFS